jgi:hypothetical protein
MLLSKNFQLLVAAISYFIVIANSNSLVGTVWFYDEFNTYKPVVVATHPNPNSTIVPSIPATDEFWPLPPNLKGGSRTQTTRLSLHKAQLLQRLTASNRSLPRCNLRQHVQHLIVPPRPVAMAWMPRERFASKTQPSSACQASSRAAKASSNGMDATRMIRSRDATFVSMSTIFSCRRGQ